MNDYQAPCALLKNKIILITGAGDGIGAVAAKTYAEYGATCILLGRTVSKLEKVYDEIVEKGYPEPAIIPLDLNGATPSHYDQMAMTIKEQFGQLDGILFNASILGHIGPFADIEPDQWQQIMQVNVNSTAFLIKSLLSVLRASDNASVILTTSSVGRKGRSFWNGYAVSKFATEGMMQVLAAEYTNRNIRFNCINPGATKTQMRASAFPAENADTLKTPEDIMPLYLYLMGDDSIEINGQSLDCQPKR
ncbi:YciK family oxidoreductase [Alteromonas sp. ASW11-130]|uniref:YciK family oxidoreductase n=1 Tax=Alteromonas sp. ASW11-130 TaxID=3015775 RepID=UPI0022423174|nr:YciK family oxidoreductase [Alteromonas sp. ASW11-130]MCW8092201.1 YciK family oxidoreductase [Alteromonas sp. ASW11-130]